MFSFGKNKVMPVSVREFVSGNKCEVKIDPNTYDDPKYSITVEEANAIANGDFSKPAVKEPEKEKNKSNKLSVKWTWIIGAVVLGIGFLVFYHFFMKRKKLLPSGNKTQNGKNSNISYAKI